jgi:hypothetical protein
MAIKKHNKTQMKKNKLILLPFVFVSITFVTCKKNEFKNLDCSKIDSKYSTSISVIFSTNCTTSGCHNGSSIFDLRTYNQIKPYIDNRDIYEEVIEKKSMPKGKSLSQDELNKIKCWLDQGGPNN